MNYVMEGELNGKVFHIVNMKGERWFCVKEIKDLFEFFTNQKVMKKYDEISKVKNLNCYRATEKYKEVLNELKR